MALRVILAALLAINIAATVWRLMDVYDVTSYQLPLDDLILPSEVFKEEHCKVLLLNEEHNYHYEVLESILVFYPLPELLSCNRSQIKFTIAIADGGENTFWRERSASWYEYATQIMAMNEYNAIEGQSRYLEKVIRSSSRPTTHNFNYQIGASCFCHNATDVEWLLESETHFCVFHEACERVAHLSRAIWVNPQMKQSLFPDVLPKFNTPRVVNTSTHNLCIVGETKRREYELLAGYLSSHPHYSGIHFHQYGIGSIARSMQPFANDITLHSIPNFLEYQFALYMICDAILFLATRSGRPQYFEGPTKLSGCIVQAAAYRKPILLHEDLEFVHRSHLAQVETYNDDAGSFSMGFERLLDRLGALKEANAAALAG